jgi:hypothetical protein
VLDQPRRAAQETRDRTRVPQAQGIKDVQALLEQRGHFAERVVPERHRPLGEARQQRLGQLLGCHLEVVQHVALRDLRAVLLEQQLED